MKILINLAVSPFRLKSFTKLRDMANEVKVVRLVYKLEVSYHNVYFEKVLQNMVHLTDTYLTHSLLTKSGVC